MRAMVLMLLAACGGDDGGSPTGVSGTVTVDGAQQAFSADCSVVESETYFDLSATNGSAGIEIKWKKALITMAGTYPTGGIVDDIVMSALKGDDTVLPAMGTTTFTTYAAPAVFAGTFDMTATGFTATGVFDCH